MEKDDEKTSVELEPVKRLTRDLAKASATLSPSEVRYLVDNYYQMQRNRITAKNQIRAQGETEEPHEVLNWFADQTETLENQIKRSLDKWTSGNTIGQWLKEITGIGPVLAAGLIAHIDIKQSPTAGHIWRYAGLDPTREWLGTVKAEKLVKQCVEDAQGNLEMATVFAARLQNVKPENLKKWATTDREGNIVPLTVKSLQAALAKRPHNGRLKTLCWKIGESFVKVSGNEADVYGKYYLARKEYESRKNEALEYADQAAKVLTTKNIGKSTDAYKEYIVGKLPPAHIHSRAKRYAVKLFLSHLHQFWFQEHFGQPAPAPYPIAILGHAHKIEPHRMSTK